MLREKAKKLFKKNFTGRNAAVVLLFTFLLVNFSALAWGFYAHKIINRLAVFTLPQEVIGFYKSHIDYITEQSVAPDKRRYVSKDEAPRHFIDIDYYEVPPFDTVPQRWDSAVAKFSEDTLRKYGIVPWVIQWEYRSLVKAFREKNTERILKVSADLGHYVADAHVPLHTTLNYNGQLTGQVGIHGFLESRLPELFASEYDYFVGKAEYIDDPLAAAWNAVEQSHLGLDSVFRFEKELSREFSDDRKFAYEDKGGTSVRVYSREYSKAYHEKLDGLVERRMRAAIKMIGSLWYSAWVDAGQPDLKPLWNKDFKPEQLKEVEKEQQQYEKGDWKGRPDL